MTNSLNVFKAERSAIDSPTVLELGTKQFIPGRSTMHRDFVPHARDFLGTDVEEGADVDIVADLHSLSYSVGKDRFDAIISCSTLEHIKYPWIAAVEIAKALTVGGFLFLQTHQTFPLHDHPSDFWRFSRESLQALFNERIGLKLLVSHYEFECKVYSERDLWLQNCPSWLNVCMCAKRVAPTPDTWIPEL